MIKKFNYLSLMKHKIYTKIVIKKLEEYIYTKITKTNQSLYHSGIIKIHKNLCSLEKNSSNNRYNWPRWKLPSRVTPK